MFDPTIPSRFDFSHVGPVKKPNFGDFFINYQFYPPEHGRKRANYGPEVVIK